MRAAGRTRSCSALVVALAVVACTKDAPKPSIGDGDVAAAAQPLEGGAPTAGDAKGAELVLVGEYTTKPGTFHVPDHKDWEKVRWRGDDAKDGVGKGSIRVVVGGDGRVRGELGEGGALGAALLSGVAHEGRVTATVLRKTADDDGFTGTLEAALSGDALRGTLRLASAASNLVREGTFEATKKP